MAAMRALAMIGAMGACGGPQKPSETEVARTSVYDADAAIIYTAAYETIEQRYPHLVGDQNAGVIRTAWHEMTATYVTGSSGGPNPPRPMMTKRLKGRYVRFDVKITGGRPWRLNVVGHASIKKDDSDKPVELSGADEPNWLKPEADALRVTIHRHIKQYAIAAPTTSVPTTHQSSD